MRIFLYSLLLVGLSFCQNKNEQIAQKWVVKTMTIADQKLDGESVNGFSLELSKDGTYNLSGMQPENGTWKIVNDSLITSPSNGKKASALIKEISNEKLVLEANSEGTFIQIEYTINK